MFNVFESMKYPCNADVCFSINVVDELDINQSYVSLMRDSLEWALIFNEDVEDSETHEYIILLNSASPYIPRHPF